MREYLKRLVSETDAFKIVLFSFLIKGLATSFSTQDVVVTVSLVALSAIKTYLDSKRPTKYQFDSQVQAELNELKGAINALKIERGINSPTKQRFF